MVREVDCRRLYTCETYLTTNHRLKNNNAWSGKACSPSKVASGSELVEMLQVTTQWPDSTRFEDCLAAVHNLNTSYCVFGSLCVTQNQEEIRHNNTITSYVVLHTLLIVWVVVLLDLEVWLRVVVEDSEAELVI